MVGENALMNVINLSLDNLIPNDVEISESVHEGYESIRVVLQNSDLHFEIGAKFLKGSNILQ